MSLSFYLLYFSICTPCCVREFVFTFFSGAWVVVNSNIHLSLLWKVLLFHLLFLMAAFLSLYSVVEAMYSFTSLTRMGGGGKGVRVSRLSDLTDGL